MLTASGLLISGIGSFFAEFPKTVAILVIFKVLIEFFLWGVTSFRYSSRD